MFPEKSMTLELGIQSLMCALMLLTIVWCILLYRRLRRLRVDRGEMALFVESLNDMITKAESAVTALQHAGREAIADHDRRREETQNCSEELARGIQIAARMLRRLDAALAGGTQSLAKIRTSQEPGPRDSTHRAEETDGGKIPHNAESSPLGAPTVSNEHQLFSALGSLR